MEVDLNSASGIFDITCWDIFGRLGNTEGGGKSGGEIEWEVKGERGGGGRGYDKRGGGVGAGVCGSRIDGKLGTWIGKGSKGWVEVVGTGGEGGRGGTGIKGPQAGWKMGEAEGGVGVEEWREGQMRGEEGGGGRWRGWGRGVGAEGGGGNEELQGRGWALSGYWLGVPT
ncbi:hypothetical protein Tco_1070052 [Tanacetum coccineum]|uniref:Uncharacterized protein n=1 Tax=Tanacetum coccineum TaxID=301880 RepID=A0ABQ5HM64_9ASTR